jgi:diketogulonate reductase-like aldo/keto reductase
MATFVELSTEVKMPIVGLGTWQVKMQILGHLLPGGSFSPLGIQWGGGWKGEISALELGSKLLSFSEVLQDPKLQDWLSQQ